MAFPTGPREWMPGPKNWKTFEIDANGLVFLDGKQIGTARDRNFRATREMQGLMELWNELDQIYHRATYVDGPTYPVRAFLHSGEPKYGRAQIQIAWQSEDRWDEVEDLVHELMDKGYRVEVEQPFMWVGVYSAKEYRAALKVIQDLARQRGISQYLPSFGSAIKEIADWIARTLFVTAWGDRQEERGITYPGQKLFDVAPQTSAKARKAAWELIKDLEQVNKLSIFEIYDQALQGANREDSDKNKEEFGYLVAMEALGHGVGLEDHFPGHGIEVPDMEFYL